MNDDLRRYIEGGGRVEQGTLDMLDSWYENLEQTRGAANRNDFLSANRDHWIEGDRERTESTLHKITLYWAANSSESPLG